jgi:hypothetical protein
MRPDHASSTVRRSAAPAALLVVVVAMSTLAGCGKSEPSARGEGVGDGFARRALAVCASAQKSKDGWSPFPVSGFNPTKPQRSDLSEVGVWLEEEVAPTFDAWRDGLTALGTPPTGREAWADVVSAVRRIADLNQAQVNAAKEGDTDAFGQATRGLGEVQPKLERASAQAGVAKCAEVHAK